jgi:hypothetical protein
VAVATVAEVPYAVVAVPNVPEESGTCCKTRPDPLLRNATRLLESAAQIRW